MTKLVIQGIECEIPTPPKIIEGSKRKVRDQMFRHTEIPSFMSTVGRDGQWNTCNIVMDEGRRKTLPLTNEQEKFILGEIEKCITGTWVMIRGEATYIPGRYYDFLNYWTTDDGIGYSNKDGRKIEYRETDRQFYIFYENTSDDSYIKGIVRGKKVREGATTQGAQISVHTATFYPNQNCGTLSNKGTNAKGTFTNMISRGFFDKPIWLQPRYDSSSSAKKSIDFIKPAANAKGDKTTTQREGLNSTISWESTSLSAYVNARLTYVLVDESGRWEEVDIYDYVTTVLQDRLVRGASKVGFAYFPTAVNSPNAGGRSFSKLWNASNQYAGNGKYTTTGFVRWFVPAYEGFSGFVDKYGRSVVDPPDAETLKDLLEKQMSLPKRERIPVEVLKLGAKEFIKRNQAALASDEEALATYKRSYPIIEADMFDFGDLYNPFNMDNLKAQMAFLQSNPDEAYWRRGKLVVHHYDEKGEPGINIQFHDDSSGHWLIKHMPAIPNNFWKDDRNIVRPLSEHVYGGGMDTFRFDKTKELGSMGTIFIGTKFDVSKPHGEDCGEVCAFWIGRPKLTELAWAEMLMAELFFGCTITAERDATQEYIKYHSNVMRNFMDANCLPMLGKKPDTAFDTTKKISDVVEYGVISSDPFAFAKQIELGVIYVQKYCYKIKLIALLEGLMNFDPSNRTSADTVVGFLIMLMAITGDFRQRKQEQKRLPMAVQYSVGKPHPFKDAFG